MDLVEGRYCYSCSSVYSLYRPVLVLGLIWQIIKIQLMSQISLKHCPELVLLVKEGEDPALLATLSPEDILLRWINHHLEKAGSGRRVTNFGSDMQVAVISISS